jgi:hypothetical protein
MLDNSLRKYEVDRNAENLLLAVVDARRERKTLFSIDFNGDFGSIYFYIVEGNKLRIDEYYIIHAPAFSSSSTYVLYDDKIHKDERFSASEQEFPEWKHYMFDYSRFKYNQKYFRSIKVESVPYYIRKKFYDYDFIHRYGSKFIEIPVFEFDYRKGHMINQFIDEEDMSF